MDLPLHHMPDPVAQARHDRTRFRRAVAWTLGFVLLLWLVKGAELLLLGAGLGELAAQLSSLLSVHPRTPAGLLGVLTAPLLHGSVAHLLSNTLPLLLLGTLALSVYPRASLRAIPLLWLGSGLGVWLFGRDAGHLGASGLGHGLLFLVLGLGLLRRDRAAVATAMIAFFLYGGMLLTVLPREAHISWESHLFGGLFGALGALLWRARDAALPRRRYSWEDEDAADVAEPSTARRDAAQFEPPSPAVVPVLWQRPDPAAAADTRGVVLPFPPRPRDGQ